jgi:hypothetical protein
VLFPAEPRKRFQGHGVMAGALNVAVRAVLKQFSGFVAVLV